MPVPNARRPFPLSWRGLNFQLLLVIILPLTALLLLVSFGSLALHHHAMHLLVGSRDLRAARAAASAIAGGLQQRDLLLQTLALQAEAGADPQTLLASAGHLDPFFEGGLAYFSPGGELLASTDPGYWKDYPYQDLLAQARLAAAKGAPAETDFISANANAARRDPGMVAVRLSPGGALLAGAFSPAALSQQVLADLFQDEQIWIELADSQGRTLYSLIPDGAAPLETTPGLEEALAGQTGVMFTGSGQDERVVAFTTIPSQGWALVIHEPWQAITSPTLRTTQTAPLVLVPVLLMALVALAFGARQIVQPLQALAAQTQELSRGHFQAIETPVGGIPEIQQLQAELGRMSRQVQAAQESLHGYIGAITTSQEDERRRLARELHDDTLQALIALDQRIQLAQLSLAGHPAGQSLQEIKDLTGQTIQNLRRLTRALRPIYLEDLGLVASLEILAQETGRGPNLPIAFHCTGTERRLPPEAELALYRIAQEGLSNIVRHAGASQASLTLTFQPEAATLVIADNGRGFQTPDSRTHFAKRGHFGLLGLHERAELIGAQLSIRSAPGEGTRLTVRLPKKTEASQG